MVRELAAAGVSVRAALHYPDHDPESRAAAVDYVEVDFDRPDTLETAFRGIDKAVLITPEETTMVAMTRRLVQAAERADVKHVVRVSFIHADKGVGGPLLAWHREAEKIVTESPVPSTILRPNSYMQNFLTMYAPSIHVRGSFYTPMGSGRISYIDARDVAGVAVRVLLSGGHEGAVYDLAGPESLTHDEIAAVLTRETGQAIRYIDVGENEACAALHRRGASDALVEALCELWLAMRRNEFAAPQPGVQDILGRPTRRFDEFVREHVHEVRVSPTARQ
jgi:uncharacterized protein YbjT (DUF2867 family)